MISHDPAAVSTDGEIVVAVTKDHTLIQMFVFSRQFPQDNKPGFRLESSAIYLQCNFSPTWNQVHGFVKLST